MSIDVVAFYFPHMNYSKIKANQLNKFSKFRLIGDNYFKIPVKIYPCELNHAMLCFQLLNGVVIRVNNTLNIICEKDITKIEIYDALGRIIISKENPSNHISVEELKNGLYTVSITLKDNKIVRKFQK